MSQWQRIHLPVQETRVRPLDLEDPLEEEMATHSSILALEIPWTEQPGGLQSMGSKKRDVTEHRELPNVPVYFLYIIVRNLKKK